ncbi:TetR/AcrR family transcriptional regulator [Kaistia dalseonensis]|uniref:AcrR family transcriptional regulator n=1 Tax=Kaistia dalseonensis TaxID=410840 RepID=A0ABU0H402_9HYPH|nr:TetR/AcrR family transcriptional regulator [Kaistia dalseonensis]MCX5494455.1 TetR/AcrR family transcriptional regulator [Kaistia dalseonensis]MDQ0437034.1 AcrR family transcriptional regulator [Kaistia dalseonensis]
MARLIAERSDVVPVLAEIFRRYGFEGTSLARITEQTRLGKGSLYHFFPGGKEEMAEAVLAHIRDWFEAEIFRPLEEDPPDEAIEHMFASVDDYFRSGRRICLVGAFALEETRDRFAAAVGNYFERWLATLSTAHQRGGMDKETADRLARDTVAGIQGAIVLARALNDETHFTAVLKTLRRATNEA